mmetsp:Transcript_14208/g.30410  ORF Transcript_14208/g.30410 Transcript_14208/m.30410 type:complete len:244 (+) Transcript_14208:166-897(+)
MRKHQLHVESYSFTQCILLTSIGALCTWAALIPFAAQPWMVSPGRQGAGSTTPQAAWVAFSIYESTCESMQEAREPLVYYGFAAGRDTWQRDRRQHRYGCRCDQPCPDSHPRPVSSPPPGPLRLLLNNLDPLPPLRLRRRCARNFRARVRTDEPSSGREWLQISTTMGVGMAPSSAGGWAAQQGLRHPCAAEAAANASSALCCSAEGPSAAAASSSCSSVSCSQPAAVPAARLRRSLRNRARA